MTDMLNILYMILGLLHLGLVFFIYQHQRANSEPFNNLSAIIIIASGLIAIFFGVALISEEMHEAFNWLVLSAVGGISGFIILKDTKRFSPLPKNTILYWQIISVIWFLALMVLWLTGNDLVGWAEESTPTTSIYIAWAGIIVTSVFIFGMISRQFFQATLPKIANRALFWLATIVLIYVGIGFTSSGSQIVALPGSVALLIALASIIYALKYDYLLDMRRSFREALRSTLSMLLLWAMIYGALIFIDRINLSGQHTTSLLAIAIAGIVAGIYAPLRSLLIQLLQRDQANEAVTSSQYSRDIAMSSSLQEVFEATNKTLAEGLQIEQSFLLLVDRISGNTLEFMVLESSDQSPRRARQGTIQLTNTVYNNLAIEKQCVLQFDILYGSAYADLTESEKEFFSSLKMNVYVPIISDNRLIGVIACGSKSNGHPFANDELEILQIIGQQVGIVLRNARLIDDLRYLNENMRLINKKLEDAKQGLETLDSVKTDFITIASHELRTPLAQFRGYTDMLDELLNQGEQTPESMMHDRVIKNLRKSISRFDELISAMLDVSQLDVDAMDLRFVETIPATIARMAIAQHQGAIEEREIQVETSGLEDLPYIHADMQRLVQAIGNIIINAIKYTPNGGTIKIRGEHPSINNKKADHVKISITDSGIGIDQSDMELVFQKFYRGFDPQLHSTGRQKFMGAGPGLGLTIAKGIVDGHGGAISVESIGRDLEKLPGTTFHIKLPIEPPAGAKRVLPFGEGEITNV